jgi:hypothetical protein
MLAARPNEKNSCFSCHASESWHPVFYCTADAARWIPACAGMTMDKDF